MLFCVYLMRMSICCFDYCLLCFLLIALLGCWFVVVLRVWCVLCFGFAGAVAGAAVVCCVLGCAGFWVVGCCDTLSGCVVGLILLGLGLVLWLSWFGWVLVFVVGFVCMLFSMLAFAIQDFGLVILVVFRRFWW